MMRHTHHRTLASTLLATAAFTLLAGSPAPVDAFAPPTTGDPVAGASPTGPRERGTVRRDLGGFTRGDAEDRHIEGLARRLRVFMNEQSNTTGETGMTILAPPTRPIGDHEHEDWIILRSTVQAMQAHLTPVAGEPPTSFSAYADLALEEAEAALHELVRVETDFPAAIDALGVSVQMLDFARLLAMDPADAIFADETLAALGDVARRMSDAALARIESAGFSTSIIAAAQASHAQGLEQLSVGNYTGAIPSFGDPVYQSESAVFDMNLFENAIRDAFDGETVGYSYAITQGGNLVRQGANGLARTVADNPLRLQQSSKEMNIASVTKTITTMAVLQVLEEKGIPLDTSIANWLPWDWTIGNGIEPAGNDPGLTFRDLLTQRSGLAGNSNPCASCGISFLQNAIAGGVNAPKDFEYQNVNFALFRVILPYLHHGPGYMEMVRNVQILGGLDPITQMYYQEIVQERVLDKAFVTGKCYPQDANQTLLYSFPDNGTRKGIKNGSWSAGAGGGGWFFSAEELAAILSYRRFTNDILSPSMRLEMDLEFLGWNDPDNGYGWGSGARGLYRSHGGDLSYNDPAPERGMGSCWVDFPNGVQAVVLINSTGGSYPYQCQVLADAYDAAWVAP